MIRLTSATNERPLHPVPSKTILRCVALAAALLSICPPRAFSYAIETAKWTLNRTVPMHLSLGGPQQLSDGFQSFNDSAADALKTWNQYMAHMKFQPIVGSTLPPADGEGDTSVLFSKTVYGDQFGTRVLAVTLFAARTSVIEADVLVNSNYSWDSYRGALRSTVYDFHRVVLHEFGHVLGLDHPDQNQPEVGYVAPTRPPVAIMTSVTGNVDSLQADDINGARALYDVGPAYRSSFGAPNLVNLSTRAFVGTDSNVLIAGFIVQGSEPATVVLRGIGRSLGQVGITTALHDPLIELRDSSGALIASSDDWPDGADADTIASYGVGPTNSHESAIYAGLDAGTYTVALRAFDNGDGDLTGTGVIELYDLHTTGGRAGNISTRGKVSSGNDVMVAGFIIGATQNKELVIRGLGPSLADAGVTDTLPDPVLELRDASGNLIRRDDNWSDDPEAASVQNSGLSPSRSNEAAMHVTLNAGPYTAILSDANNATGIGLVELYDLSPAP